MDRRSGVRGAHFGHVARTPFWPSCRRANPSRSVYLVRSARRRPLPTRLPWSRAEGATGGRWAHRSATLWIRRTDTPSFGNGV